MLDLPLVLEMPTEFDDRSFPIFRVASAAQRGVFTAVFWLWKPPIPCVFVTNEEEGFRLARDAIARAGATPEAP